MSEYEDRKTDAFADILMGFDDSLSLWEQPEVSAALDALDTALGSSGYPDWIPGRVGSEDEYTVDPPMDAPSAVRQAHDAVQGALQHVTELYALSKALDAAWTIGEQVVADDRDADEEEVEAAISEELSQARFDPDGMGNSKEPLRPSVVADASKTMAGALVKRRRGRRPVDPLVAVARKAVKASASKPRSRVKARRR